MNAPTTRQEMAEAVVSEAGCRGSAALIELVRRQRRGEKTRFIAANAPGAGRLGHLMLELDENGHRFDLVRADGIQRCGTTAIEPDLAGGK